MLVHGVGRSDGAGGVGRRELAPIEFVRLRIEGCVSAGGARPAVFYLLAHGEVDVFVGGTHRRSLGPNDFFGEISMLVLVPATATVVTRTPVRAYVMSHRQFLEVRVHESVMLQLKSAMGDRRSADRKLVSYGTVDLPTKPPASGAEPWPVG